MEKFTAEVQKELKHYVYRLIDPRNGMTFYVGQGEGNRIFDHINRAIKFKDDKDEDKDNLKYRQIIEINAAGLEVIHLIHRWGLEKNEANEVESALIDAYSGLTNKQSGYDSERGVANVKQIVATLSAEVYTEPNFKYIIAKTQQAMIEERLSKYSNLDDAIFDATSHSRKIEPSNWDDCKYVFSVTDQIVKEVYVFDKWIADENRESRYYFVCPNGGIQKADDKIRNEFIGKRIPEIYRKKGMANPVLKGGKG